MKRANQFPLLYVTSVLALFLSGLAVRPAFAAGNPPPPLDVPSVVASPSSASSSDTGSSGPTAGTHQAADDSGRHAALARQQAADLEVNGDPRWCPSGVVPHNGGGCSAGFPSLAALAAGFTPAGNGTIWIERGPAFAGVIFGSGGFWTGQNAFNLTFQGGWNGHLGSTGLSKASPLDPYPLSTFTDVLFIHGWVGNVTMKNLQFSSAALDEGRNYSQLEVLTMGNITLNKVQVFNARSSNLSYAAGGALLDTTAGSGSVLISQSLFNHNQAMGVEVLSNDNITLQNMVVDLNGTIGAEISNHPAPIPHPVSVSNSEFNGNGDRGLDIFSDGAVTLTSLTANNNSEQGVHVDNGMVLSASVAYPFTMKGVNNFNFNQSDGLYVYSYGPIRVSKTTANGNFSDGVYLLNADSFNPQPVTILGYLTANANISDGLYTRSVGAVSATKLTANRNGSLGALLTNTGAAPGFPAPITLLGVNTFNANAEDGLRAFSNGDIKVSNLTASFNGQYGAHLDNTGSQAAAKITLAGYGRFEWNGSGGSYRGLWVDSHGAVTLANLRANYNAGTGAFINVTGFFPGHTAPQPVTLTGANQFNFNGLSGLSGVGLAVFTDGKIAASNIRASNNFSGGAILDNYNNWLSSGFATNSIILSGVNAFNGNRGNGLFAIGNGAIVVSHVTANSNAADGILAQAGSSSFPVTVVCSSAHYNGDSNLEVSLALKIFLKGYVSYPLNEDNFNAIPVAKSGCP